MSNPNNDDASTTTTTTTTISDNMHSDLVSSIQSSWMVLNHDFDPASTDLTHLKHVWDSLLLEEMHLGAASLQSFLPTATNNAMTCTSVWWDRLVTLHSLSNRAYHTTRHLEELLGYMDLVITMMMDRAASNNQILQPSDDKSVLLLSILFHDAIYDPKSGTNEEESAKLFEEFSAEVGLTDDIRNRVVRYILATKTHEPVVVTTTTDNNEHQHDLLLALFLDMDMAVLGKDEASYDKYAALIRKEYQFVERNVYCEKRAAILETFLDSQVIFGSYLFRQALEERARANLRREITLLKTGIIPGDNHNQEALVL